MSETFHKCPKCESQMNSGFVADRTQPGPERFAMRFRPSYFYQGELKLKLLNTAELFRMNSK